MEYDTLTDQINNLVSSGLTTDWNAVTGGMDKVVGSSKGFAWGISSGSLWMCRLPCTGNWTKVDTPGTAKDVVADENVYVLLDNKLAVKSSDNVDQWVTIDLPDKMEKIINTSSYIWGQAGAQKYKLPKPGMSGNWIAVKDELDVKITSASATHLYGVKDGQAMVTDETMQTKWSVIPEFGKKYTAIIGDADETAIYGISDDQGLERCMHGVCKPMDTKGYTPQSITIEPSSKQMWMTTTRKGDSGNIFTQPMMNDYSQIIKDVHPIDEKRDQVVQEAQIKFKEDTGAGVMAKQFKLITDMLQNFFNIKPQNEDTKNLEDGIKDTQYHLFFMKNILPYIQKMLGVLAVVVVVYLASDYLGFMTHIIALGLLVGGGIFFAVHK